MSEQKSPVTESEPVEPPKQEEAEKDDSKAGRLGGWLVGVVILGSLAWYLAADRQTPFTSQARVQGYVVGIAPKVGGLVTRVFVENNREVRAGDPLFEIDRSQYRIALDKARSDLENARRQVEAGGAGVEAARANLRAKLASETKAEKDFSRLERLRREDPGTVSVRRLEISRATLDQARAQVAAAEADIQRAIEQKGGDDEAGNAILQSAASAVAKAELDLSNTIVKASAPGVITDLRADVGQYAGAGSPVMTLVSVHDVWINAEFTENNLGHMRLGTPVEILFDALPGKVFEGTVRSIGLGVSGAQAPPPGTLPKVQNNRDWLRQAQRFPVIVQFDVDQDSTLRGNLRIGGQAAVIAYSRPNGLLRVLGAGYIRLMSWFSYAY